jgi:hypothetical protein
MDDQTITCLDCDTPADKPLEHLYKYGFMCSICRTQHQIVEHAGRPLAVRVAVNVMQGLHAGLAGRTSPGKPLKLSLTYRVDIHAFQNERVGTSMVNVFDKDGTPVVSGVAMNPVDALTEVIPWLLPEGHPQHPKSLTTPE